MRAANYYRVSTKLQEKRYSLSAQRSELTKYAELQGWKLIDEFTDVETGGKLDKKGLNALLDMVEEGRIDVVLCIDQDRLSRLDTIAWEYLKATLRENNVKIAEPGILVDLNNEDDEFISDIKNLIARREKKSVVKRMMRGKRQRMREGKGWGKPPFEYIYNKEKSRYEINKDWAWVIPFIDDLYLNKQIGMVSIAQELNKISKTPTSNHWNETLILRRLISKAFHGVMEKTFNNGETIAIENIYPPLRTLDTYNKIQKVRSQRSEQFKVTSRQRDDLHILRRTKITCGECGRKIALEQHGDKNKPRYYLRHGRKKSIADGSICDVNINSIRVELNIIKALKDIMTSEESAKKYLNLDFDTDEIKALEKQVKINEKQIMKIEGKIDALLDLFLDGKFSKDTLAKKQDELEKELIVLRKQTEPMKTKLELLSQKALNYDSVYEVFEFAHNFDTDFTPKERANMFGDLFPNAILYRDKMILQTPFSGTILDVEVPVELDPYKTIYRNKRKQ